MAAGQAPKLFLKATVFEHCLWLASILEEKASGMHLPWDCRAPLLPSPCVKTCQVCKKRSRVKDTVDLLCLRSGLTFM